MEKNTYWTIAQKAIAAPSIVEIDKQLQLKPRNEQFRFRNMQEKIEKYIFHFFA